MRLKLTLEVNPKANLLPLNYQYGISAWIYRMLQAGSPEFSQWLHEQGMVFAHRQFKGVVFSDIHLNGRYKRFGDRFRIFNGTATLIISFLLDKAVEHFIIGLFQSQQLTVEDYKSNAEFYVQSVERLPEPQLSPVMTFKTLSPVCLTQYRPENKHATYLSPETPDYSVYFFNHLLNKYRAFTGDATETEALSREMQQQQPFAFQLLDKPKSRLVKIKAGKPDETHVRGYHYSFRIAAPPELLNVGYHAGFGEKNATGFGCVAVANEA